MEDLGAAQIVSGLLAAMDSLAPTARSRRVLDARLRPVIANVSAELLGGVTDALQDFCDVARSDYDEAEDYAEAREEAWQAFRDALEELAGELSAAEDEEEEEAMAKTPTADQAAMEAARDRADTAQHAEETSPPMGVQVRAPAPAPEQPTPSDGGPEGGRGKKRPASELPKVPVRLFAKPGPLSRYCRQHGDVAAYAALDDEVSLSEAAVEIGLRSGEAGVPGFMLTVRQVLMGRWEVTGYEPARFPAMAAKILPEDRDVQEYAGALEGLEPGRYPAPSDQTREKLRALRRELADRIETLHKAPAMVERLLGAEERAFLGRPEGLYVEEPHLHPKIGELRLGEPYVTQECLQVLALARATLYTRQDAIPQLEPSAMRFAEALLRDLTPDAAPSSFDLTSLTKRLLSLGAEAARAVQRNG